MTSDARDLSFWCPKCGALVVLPNKDALRLIEAAGACHLCRLEKTVEFLISAGNVTLLSDVLRFMEGYEGFRVEVPQWLV